MYQHPTAIDMNAADNRLQASRAARYRSHSQAIQTMSGRTPGVSVRVRAMGAGVALSLLLALVMLV